MFALSTNAGAVNYFHSLTGEKISDPVGVYTVFRDGKTHTFKTYQSRGERAHVALLSSDERDVKIEARYHRLAFLLRAVGNYSHTESLSILSGRETELSLMNGGRKVAIRKVLRMRGAYRV
jgi:hypothetical protein